jgi:hypothetical protein
VAANQKPTDVLLNAGGVPETLTVRVPRSIGGYFADGAAFINADTYTMIIPIAGALSVRLRGKSDGDGTLSFAYRRPPGQGSGQGSGNAATSYDSSLEPPHANVAVTGATEFLVDITPIGECFLAITWDPSEAGAWNFFDVLSR